jgi:serine/threonine protein kinase
LVHRDIKPANILVESGGRILLTDFGLARAVDDAGLTQSGIIPGTPQYMAPEQAQGECADHYSDLFSLGSTLYAMCTGEAPFGSDSPLAVLRRVCDGNPQPVRSINPDVPYWLVAIIEKLHAKSPADRFASASEVAELLSGCLAHVQRPELVPLPAKILDICPSPRQSRAHWIALGVLLLVSLGTTLVLCWPASHDPDSRQEAVSTTGREDRLKEKPGSVPSPRALQPTTQKKDHDPLFEQIQALRQQAGALEAEWKRSGGDFNDPAHELLQDVHRRLDALNRDLNGSAPRGH